ncbi:MAG: hypothetical protein AAGE18_08775 [Pseudomonadota bacterium]
MLLSAFVVLAASERATAEPFIEIDNRLLVQTEGRDDYSPRIVQCDVSATGLCLHDTRSAPPDNPIDEMPDGRLRVAFPGWDIIYVIAPDGTGETFDGAGTALAPFRWSLIPE